MVSLALMISSLIILIGFLANYLFKKTGFPDMLILILLGAVFGPVLGAFDPVIIQGFAPYIAALALAYILFDGGMGLNLRQVILNSPKALVLAISGFVLSVIVTAVFMLAVFNMPILYGLLLGGIVGGSSSVVVISLASKIKISEKSATVLILESALTDVFSIVICIALLDVIITGQTDVVSIGMGVALRFLIGALIGIGLGFAWLFALRKLATLDFSYILTLGTILLGYAVSEILGGNGALSALIFGLILGNERGILGSINNFLKINTGNEIFEGKPALSVGKGLKRFESEIAFLIQTFFYVFLGIIASVNSITVLAAGIGLSIILYLTRYGAVWITTFNCPLKKERQVLTAVLTRGLATAVLATLPAQYGLPYADLFVNISIVIIIATAIMATAGCMIAQRQNKNDT
jgi:potassium/hydrogen antiporter